MGLPQYGHVPDVVPASAATGCPQLGHVPVSICDPDAFSALGLKHMMNLLSVCRAFGLGYLM
jgi:hypothetical protein